MPSTWYYQPFVQQYIITPETPDSGMTEIPSINTSNTLPIVNHSIPQTYEQFLAANPFSLNSALQSTPSPISENKDKKTRRKKHTEIDIDKTKISNLYKYSSLSKYEGLTGNIPVRAGTTFVGLEIETEQLIINSIPSSVWGVVEDGSLRDNGREFVSVPIQFKYLEVELKRLVNGLVHYNMSSRCSIHTHINVRDFSLKELATFIVLYVIFERSMYNYSGGRTDNNFCVPITYYPQMVGEFMRRLVGGEIYEKWYKYYGFNLSPIFGGESSQIGTVEFRHMVGTLDIPWIINWINLIVSLKITAKKMPFSELVTLIENMNTTSGYYWLSSTVFKEYAPLITEQPSFKQDVERCISVAKDAFVSASKEVFEIPILKKKG